MQRIDMNATYPSTCINLRNGPAILQMLKLYTTLSNFQKLSKFPQLRFCILNPYSLKYISISHFR